MVRGQVDSPENFAALSGMLVEKSFVSWNASSQAVNCSPNLIVHVEIITLALYFGLDQGGLFYVQPAYEEALQDIGRKYPCFRVRQNVIYLPNKSIVDCTDLIPVSHDLLGQYYYRNTARWDAANVTTFLTNSADCNSQAAGVFATNTLKLLISVGVPPDFQSKAKWPTRIAMGARATGARTISASALSLCKFHNWTTVALVCDGPGQGPTSCAASQTLKRDLAVFVEHVDVVVVDGFSPSFNYVAALTILSQKTRVIIYVAMSKGAMRNILITASNLNMTNGEYVHVIFVNYATDYTWKWNDKNDQLVRQAYDSVIMVEQDQSRDAPPKGTPFYRIKEKWRQRSTELFNFTYSLTEPNPHLFAAYDMLLMVATAVEGLIAKNRSAVLGDGKILYRQFLNRTFQTKTGSNYIDSAGSVAGLSKVITQYMSNHTTEKETKYFMEGLEFDMREVAPISWPGPIWPVPSRPRCGFTGLDPDCLPPKDVVQEQAAIGGSVSCTIFVLVVSAAIWWRLRSADQASWWIIDAEDLRSDREMLMSTSKLNLQYAMRMRNIPRSSFVSFYERPDSSDASRMRLDSF